MHLPRPPALAEQHKSSWPAAASTRSAYTGLAGALNVLVVEDDAPVRDVCSSLAQSIGCRVRSAASISEANHLLHSGPLDVVLLDLHLPDGSGASLLDAIQQCHPRAMVTVMSAHATVTVAMEMVRRGAVHVLEKPFTLQQVKAALEHAAEKRQGADSSRALQDQLQAGVAPGRLIAYSTGMRRVLSMVSKVASSRHPVLISGEHGSGKETVGRTIHANGPSSTSPFVPVDCDALDNGRLELELFGDPDHSDPHRRRGLLATAEDGTVCLNEIGAMSPPLQARLLRALESRQLRSSPLAGPVPFRARVIACSSQDLEAQVASGRFRRDLFYKLNVTHLRVPPLRERSEDLAALAEVFVEEQRRQLDLPLIFSENASLSMQNYPWPGNVAELEAVIARACATCQGVIIHLDELSTPVVSYQAPATPAPAPPVEPFLTLDQREREAIVSAMQIAASDKAAAARLLGIGKTTLYRKLKELCLADDLHG